jgi:CBF1 interacting corepressor
MYQQPPGFKEMQEREKQEADERKRREMDELKEREEEAAREAAGLPPKEPEKPQRHQFKKDIHGNKVMTEAEMPELKGAPKMAGVGLARVQPFGKQVKAVQCMRCGGFGHVSTDKECPKRDHNPADEFRVKLEDPLTLMRARDGLMKDRKFALKTPMTIGRSPTRGGCDPDGVNQQMMLGDAGEDALQQLEAGRPGGILDSLPKSERKRLIKEYRAQEKASKKAKIKAAEEYLKSKGVKKGKEKRRA